MREDTPVEPPASAGGARALSSAERPPTRIPLWLLLLVATLLLLIGASKGFGLPQVDVAEYQCYARAFWGGSSAVAAAHLRVCPGYLGTVPTAPFAILPREYGPLALIPFSLPALAPANVYPWLFAAEMLAVVYAVTWLLLRFGVPYAAHAWLFYVMLGSMATALGRFDIVPSACVVVALIALRQDRQKLAYAALAAGVLLKFYPLLLLPLFLIHTWRRRTSVPVWRGPSSFAGVTAAVLGLAALLDPTHVLDPLRFMGTRCVQVEALPATLAALGAWLTHQPIQSVEAFNATCELAPGVDAAGTACTILGLIGMAFVVWLFWQRRLTLTPAAILLLCVSILTSKVFSPQYLLWVSPLVAYEYGLRNLRVFALWGTLCLLTTAVFPLSYASLILLALRLATSDAVPVTAALRNIVFAGELVGVLWWVATHSRRAPDRSGEASQTALVEVLP